VNGWDDLVAEALDALGDVDPSRARAKEESFIEKGVELSTSSDQLNGGWRRPTDKASELDDPDLRDALAAVEDVVGATDVIAITTRPSFGGYLLDGDLDDFYAAVDQLDRETCRASPCQPGHRCRRHSRRQKPT
jgi:hypothetical protein